MKIIACFYCEDHLLESFGGIKLMNSWKYFHPDIPIIWYGNKKADFIRKKYEKFDFLSFECVIMYETKLQYNADIIIFIDCDSIVLDRLDEVLKGDYEVASVRNDPIQHTENEDHNRPIKGVPNEKWVNAGFIVTNGDKFLLDWIAINADALYNKSNGIHYYKMVENDTLNILFHSGKYKTKILDAVDTNLYYGPASQYNTLNRKPPKSIERYGYYFCESWLDIKLVNNKPTLNNKYIKVLHQCHGGGPPKLQYELFSDEFLPYVKKITQCDF